MPTIQISTYVINTHTQRGISIKKVSVEFANTCVCTYVHTFCEEKEVRQPFKLIVLLVSLLPVQEESAF